MLHLSSTSNLKRRLARLFDPKRATGARLLDLLAGQRGYVAYWVTGSTLETALQMYQLAKSFFPQDYLRRLRLRHPWFVTLTANRFPRLIVSNRARAEDGAGSGLVLGPFVNRDAATRFEDAALSLFQIRRCAEHLDPSPQHPGCVYGEMNLCLRPCQAAVTDSEYRTEVSRMRQFLTDGAQPMLTPLASARDQAVERLDFESAAQIQKQVLRVEVAEHARPESLRPIDRVNGVAVTPSSLDGHVRLTLMMHAHWQPAVELPIELQTARSESLDSRLKAVLTPLLAEPTQTGDRMEHLALLSRWLHSSSRNDDWFSFEERSGPPYRKISRSISKLMGR